MIAGVVVLAVVGRDRDRGGDAADASPGPSSTVAAAGSPVASAAAATASSGAMATPSSAPTARPTPPRTAAPTAPPRATGDPRLAYAEFLLRVNDDRATVERLNRALATAADAQDPKTVTTAAVAILDFVDGERDWLREHPPADCYAEAHAAANTMLEAYGSAADKFVTWAAAGGGFAGLTALGDARRHGPRSRVTR